MSLDMVLNELSLRPASDVHGARERMLRLLATARAGATAGLQRVLRTRPDFNQAELAPGYPLARWRNDPEVDREAQRYFRSIVTKSALLSDDDDAEVRERQALSECTLNGQNAEGLAAAWLLRSLAVSVDSEAKWRRPVLALETRALEQDGNLLEAIEEIPHASEPEHVAAHREWIERQRKDAVRDGTEAWEKREKLYPHLDLCASLEATLLELGPGHAMCHGVLKRLAELEAYFRGWTDGPFDARALPSKATPESESTLQQFAKERTFLCPDGEERVFEWHLRLTPGSWRIYFHPDAERRRCIVGYIGPHLSTAMY